MMLKHTPIGIFLFLSSVALLGCATTDDPREGGYFDALYGITTGSYDKRIEDRRTQLNNLYSTNADLKIQRDKLDAEKAQIDNELIANQESLASLQQELEAFDEKLNLARSQGKIQKKTYNTLRQQVAALSKQARSHSDDNADLKAKRVRIEELKKRKRQLEDSMQKAID